MNEEVIKAIQICSACVDVTTQPVNELRKVMLYLETIPHFQKLKYLPNFFDLLNLASQNFKLSKYSKGGILCKQNDRGDKFFLLLEGEVGVYVLHSEKNIEKMRSLRHQITTIEIALEDEEEYVESQAQIELQEKLKQVEQLSEEDKKILDLNKDEFFKKVVTVLESEEENAREFQWEEYQVKNVSTLKVNSTVGEFSLAKIGRRTASVIATADQVIVAWLPFQIYNQVFDSQIRYKENLAKNLLSFFPGVGETSSNQLSYFLQELNLTRKHVKNIICMIYYLFVCQVLYREGEDITCIFFIEEGSIQLTKKQIDPSYDKNEGEFGINGTKYLQTNIALLQPNQFFGYEQQNSKNFFTAVVAQDKTKVLKLPIKHMMQTSDYSFLKVMYKRSEKRISRYSERIESINQAQKSYLNNQKKAANKLIASEKENASQKQGESTPPIPTEAETKMKRLHLQKKSLSVHMTLIKKQKELLLHKKSNLQVAKGGGDNTLLQQSQIQQQDSLQYLLPATSQSQSTEHSQETYVQLTPVPPSTRQPSPPQKEKSQHKQNSADLHPKKPRIMKSEIIQYSETFQQVKNRLTIQRTKGKKEQVPSFSSVSQASLLRKQLFQGENSERQSSPSYQLRKKSFSQYQNDQKIKEEPFLPLNQVSKFQYKLKAQEEKDFQPSLNILPSDLLQQNSNSPTKFSNRLEQQSELLSQPQLMSFLDDSPIHFRKNSSIRISAFEQAALRNDDSCDDYEGQQQIFQKELLEISSDRQIELPFSREQEREEQEVADQMKQISFLPHKVSNPTEFQEKQALSKQQFLPQMNIHLRSKSLLNFKEQEKSLSATPSNVIHNQIPPLETSSIKFKQSRKSHRSLQLNNLDSASPKSKFRSSFENFHPPTISLGSPNWKASVLLGIQSTDEIMKKSELEPISLKSQNSDIKNTSSISPIKIPHVKMKAIKEDREDLSFLSEQDKNALANLSKISKVEKPPKISNTPQKPIEFAEDFLTKRKQKLDKLQQLSTTPIAYKVRSTIQNQVNQEEEKQDINNSCSLSDGPYRSSLSPMFPPKQQQQQQYQQYLYEQQQKPVQSPPAKNKIIKVQKSPVVTSFKELLGDSGPQKIHVFWSPNQRPIADSQTDEGTQTINTKYGTFHLPSDLKKADNVIPSDKQQQPPQQQQQQQPQSQKQLISSSFLQKVKAQYSQSLHSPHSNVQSNNNNNSQVFQTPQINENESFVHFTKITSPRQQQQQLILSQQKQQKYLPFKMINEKSDKNISGVPTPIDLKKKLGYKETLQSSVNYHKPVKKGKATSIMEQKIKIESDEHPITIQCLSPRQEYSGLLRIRNQMANGYMNSPNQSISATPNNSIINKPQSMENCSQTNFQQMKIQTSRNQRSSERMAQQFKNVSEYFTPREKRRVESQIL